MPEETSDSPRFSAVALFPLPNVVLFPRAVLPLHIFEQRYRQMMADALAGDRRFAMALLRAGWEKNYYGRAPVDPVVCVGRILSHEKLPDGSYNLLLQGETRARVVAEELGHPYRVACLRPLRETEHLEIDLVDERLRLTSLFSSEALGELPAAKHYRQIVASQLPTAEVVDLLAFNLIEDVHIKQSLLAETDVRKRVTRTVSVIESLCPVLEAAARKRSQSMN